MYPIPTLHTKRPLGLRRSYVLIFTLGMVLGDPWGSRASVHFFEIKIGSELALVGRSGDAWRRVLADQRSGDAASSTGPERGRQLCMQPLAGRAFPERTRGAGQHVTRRACSRGGQYSCWQR